MKKNIIFIFLLLCCFFNSAANDNIYRYGIFLASSKGYNENTLSNATSEVKSVANLFKEYCKLDDRLILNDPGNQELSKALKEASDIIKRKRSGYQTQFFFYYYGHGLPEGLLLGNELFKKNQLKKQINEINADIKIIFLDACSSEIMGKEDNLNFQTNAEGTIYITSSSLFQQSYSDIFTPLLKAGLMGDADGFIPEEFETVFLYNNIIRRLNNTEQKIISDNYRFKNYYYYSVRGTSEEKKIKNIFHSLGWKNIPTKLDLNQFQNNILNKLDNSQNKKLIISAYNYNEVCKLKPNITMEEMEKIRRILIKIGFNKDNFVTLSELFSYLRLRISEKEVLQQTPTINTNRFHRKSPIKLSYIDNKIKLILNYPGIVFINRVLDDNMLENLVKLSPRLNNGDPTQVTLNPGKYVFIVETDKVRYRIEKTISAGDKVHILDKPEWSSMVAYKETVTKKGIKEDVWTSKDVLLKKKKIYKVNSIVFPALTFTSFALPLSLIFSAVYYNYTAETYYSQYMNTSDPNDAVAYRIKTEEMTEVRNRFYIAAGISFALPVIPFIIWMVMIYKHNQQNKKIDSIKNRLISENKIDINFNSDRMEFAYKFKI